MGGKFAALSLGLALIAGSAGAADQWVSTPTRADDFAAWPASARAAGTGGSAAMRCDVDSVGGLSACALIADRPTGMGFGPGLLALAPRYRLDPKAVPTAAPDGHIVVVRDWYLVDTPPDWRHRPTAEEIRSVWPNAAMRKGIGGKALINCVVALQGTLFDCIVVSESPPGEHFGDAAIALTPQLLMKPAMAKGQPVLSDVTIPLTFQGDAMRGRDSGPELFNTNFVVPSAISWTAAPTAQDVSAAYPAKAAAAKVPGYANLTCGFHRDGKLTNCEVVREEPRSFGFGEAAKALAKRFQIDPAFAAGRSITGGAVSLPVTFDPLVLVAGEEPRGKPVWTRFPEPAELTAAEARYLKPDNDGGHAMLQCQIDQGGVLSACSVASEQPAGIGLGDTALSLQSMFRVATWSAEGLPIVGGTVLLPLRFENEAAPPTPPAH